MSSDLLRRARQHGRTLRNGGADDPIAIDRFDTDGDLIGWDIAVADGQVCARVPVYPDACGGEQSDGGPLTDWRDAILESGALLAQLANEVERLNAEVDALRASRAEALALVRAYADSVAEPATSTGAPSLPSRWDPKRTKFADDLRDLLDGLREVPLG